MALRDEANKPATPPARLSLEPTGRVEKPRQRSTRPEGVYLAPVQALPAQPPAPPPRMC